MTICYLHSHWLLLQGISCKGDGDSQLNISMSSLTAFLSGWTTRRMMIRAYNPRHQSRSLSIVSVGNHFEMSENAKGCYLVFGNMLEKPIKSFLDPQGLYIVRSRSGSVRRLLIHCRFTHSPLQKRRSDTSGANMRKRKSRSKLKRSPRSLWVKVILMSWKPLIVCLECKHLQWSKRSLQRCPSLCWLFLRPTNNTILRTNLKKSL